MTMIRIDLFQAHITRLNTYIRINVPLSRFQATYTGPDKPSGQMVLENMGHDSWTVPEAADSKLPRYLF